MFSAFTGRDGQKPFCVEDDDLVKIINPFGDIEGPSPVRQFNWREVVAYEIIEKAEKKRKIEFLIDEISHNTTVVSSPSDINKIVDFLYEEDYLDDEEVGRCMRNGQT